MQSLATVGPRCKSVGPSLPPLSVNIYEKGRVVRTVELPDPRAALIRKFNEEWVEGDPKAGLPPIAKQDYSAAIAAIVTDPDKHCVSRYRLALCQGGRRIAMGPTFLGSVHDWKFIRRTKRRFRKLCKDDPVDGVVKLFRRRDLSGDAQALPPVMQVGVYNPARPDKPPKLAGPKFYRTSLKELRAVFEAVQRSQQALDDRGLEYCIGVFDAAR